MSSNTIYYLIVFAILLIVGFALAVIWFFTIAQRKIVGTQLKQKEAEVTFQKELLANTIATQENERDRIAKELHDDIGSKLNIATLNVHLLKKKLTLDEDTQTILDRLYEALNNSASRTRSISHELMPPVLQNFGFVYALEELQNSINGSGAVNINITNQKEVKIEDKLKLLHIYRIIQELISNTLKYAKATVVEVSFEESGENIILSYKDNGLGFDKNKASKGMGFSNLNARTELLKGKMSYETSIGNGFSLLLKFINND